MINNPSRIIDLRISCVKESVADLKKKNGAAENVIMDPTIID